MTDQRAFVGVRPISWPRAAIGAALFIGLMIVLFVVFPNLFVTPDPSQSTKIITIVYVVAVFGIVAWMIAAWQNHKQAAPPPDKQRISAFGRPMREGPGFAAFAKKGVPIPELQPVHARFPDGDPSENASSFGRPLKKKSQ